MSSGIPSWTSNITARGTMAGPAGIALADLPDRIIAWIIDAIIIGLSGAVVSTVFGAVLRETRTENILGLPVPVEGPSLIGQVIAVVIIVAAVAAYFIYMWSRMGGATIGQKMMKLTVHDATTGAPITQQQAITRWLVLGLPMSLYFLYDLPIALIPFIASVVILIYQIYLLATVAQSSTRQGFHDKYANTVVAKG